MNNKKLNTTTLPSINVRELATVTGGESTAGVAQGVLTGWPSNVSNPGYGGVRF